MCDHKYIILYIIWLIFTPKLNAQIEYTQKATFEPAAEAVTARIRDPSEQKQGNYELHFPSTTISKPLNAAAKEPGAAGPSSARAGNEEERLELRAGRWTLIIYFDAPRE